MQVKVHKFLQDIIHISNFDLFIVNPLEIGVYLLDDAKEPGAQSIQDVLPEVEYFPAGHIEHDEAALLDE
jgi:hypothetical protein